MRFDSEQQLVDSFLSVSEDFFDKFIQNRAKKHFVLQEFDSKFGIADIVVGSYKSYFGSEKRRKQVDPNWVMPLVKFNIDSTINVKEFMDIYGVSRTTALQKLREYAEAKFLEPVNKNEYRILKNYKTVVDTVISFEAKLKDWKKALRQAYRYQKFSNYSYVLLDENHINPAINNLGLFVKHNIGLISMDGNTCLTYYNPVRKEQKLSQHYLRVNEAAFSIL